MHSKSQHADGMSGWMGGLGRCSSSTCMALSLEKLPHSIHQVEAVQRPKGAPCALRKPAYAMHKTPGRGGQVPRRASAQCASCGAASPARKAPGGRNQSCDGRAHCVELLPQGIRWRW